MRLLLDTHALLWWLNDDPRLGNPARDAIVGASLVMISMASLWEIAVKVALAKLEADLGGILIELERNNMPLLPITPNDCLAVSLLAHHHGDPFDRMLIVQANARGLTIMSNDTNFPAYGFALLRCS